MNRTPESKFGELLRQHRVAAGLTQATLAEQARLSRRAISDLERGLRDRPRPETIHLLSDALGLTAVERSALEARVRRARRPVAPASSPPGGGGNLENERSPDHNLPTYVSSFVGREREVAELRDLLQTSRLVTLLGPGGCGKTRLAVRAARELFGDFPDGVWLIDLAPLSDPNHVAHRLAALLEIREQVDRPTESSLTTYLQSRRTLLVFDNCEHLVDASAHLAETVLRSCPSVRILATSRAALGIPGEVRYTVPPFRFPTAEARSDGDGLRRFDAVELFIERAQAIRPGFALAEDNAPAVVEICQRADGLPLAIELAAAWVRVLPVEQIAARFGDRFRLLTGGSRTASRRHQTLRAMIDWSYDLLSEREQALFRPLAVFAGGWTLEAAEAVCSEGVEGERIRPQHPTPDIPSVLDLLAGLVDKSLVVVDGGSTGPNRFRLLETLREYAMVKLVASGEVTMAHQRHADYYLALAARSDTRGDFLESIVRRRDFSEGLVRVGLVVEYDNFRAALRWFSEANDWEGCLHLIGALSHDWLSYGYLFDPIAWIDLILQHKDTVSPATRGLALRGAGLMALTRADTETALAAFHESLETYRGTGDGFGVAISLIDLALVLLGQSDPAPAAEVLDEALRESRSAGDPGLILISLNLQGVLAGRTGDLERAERIYNEVLETLSRNGKGPGMRGDTLFRLGEVAEEQGQLARARELYGRGIALLHEGGYRRSLPGALEACARIASREGQFERALVLAGAASSMRERLASPIPPVDKSRLDGALLVAREHIGEAAGTAAWDAGKAMSIDEVMLAYRRD